MKGFAEENRVQFPPVRPVHLQDDHRRDVVDGHGTDDHQRRHSHVVIQILDHRNAQNGSAAAIGRLNELPLDAPILQKIGNSGANQDAGQRGQGAVHHVSGIPVCPIVRPVHVVKEQRRKANPEHQRVEPCGKSIVHQLNFPEKHPQKNQKKDGHRRVKTKNQII